MSKCHKHNDSPLRSVSSPTFTLFQKPVCSMKFKNEWRLSRKLKHGLICNRNVCKLNSWFRYMLNCFLDRRSFYLHIQVFLWYLTGWKTLIVSKQKTVSSLLRKKNLSAVCIKSDSTLMTLADTLLTFVMTGASSQLI